LFFTAKPVVKQVPAAVPEMKETPPPPPAPKKAATKKQPPKPAPVDPPKPVENAKVEPVKPQQETPSVSRAVDIPYLGLRYSLLQDKPGGARQEVDPDKVFRSGEKFYLSLESNDAAYLYVVLEASQGSWEVLFPNSQIDHGNNRLNARTPVLVPSPNNPFLFDENPGTEKLFIILSRQPEADLNELIRSVKSQQPGRENSGAFKTIIASNNLDKIRGQMALASRGIVVEGVKKSEGENAVYMVNTSTAQKSARVIADIVLKHQ
jgi:hypothetical protein